MICKFVYYNFLVYNKPNENYVSKRKKTPNKNGSFLYYDFLYFLRCNHHSID